MRFTSDFEKLEGFIHKPMDFNEEFDVVGYFPYEKAMIRGREIVKAPRKLYADIENKLAKMGINDNKIVVIFKDTVNFGTDDFALNLKDCWAKVGKLESVKQYTGEELKMNITLPDQDPCNFCGKTFREQLKGCNEITCYRQYLKNKL